MLSAERYRQAAEALEASTDAAVLQGNFRTYALRFLFDKLDFKKTCCISFKQIAQALVMLKLEPRVDAKRAMQQLFPAAACDTLAIFIHLAFDAELQKRAEVKLDSTVISDAIYELGLTSTANLMESALDLCSQGGPEDVVHFESFDDFISDQMYRTGHSVVSLRNLIPDVVMFPELQVKYSWGCACRKNLRSVVCDAFCSVTTRS